MAGDGRRESKGGGRPGGRQTGPKQKRPGEGGQRVPAGYEVRALAVRLVSAVLDRKRSLDDALAVELTSGVGAGLEARDRGLARLIAATTLRRRGELDAVIAHFIERPLPADRGLLSTILSCAAAQLLLLEIAPHAVINIAVEQCRHDRGARRFDKLANAVLRRVSERGREVLESQAGARMNVPGWMWERWAKAYGVEGAAAIALASLREAPLDLTVKDWASARSLAEQLGGVVLGTGTIRIGHPDARIEQLPGFAEGAWWVQDAAAALPVQFLGDVAGKAVADLCAAPGGKTAQLAARGARVTAVDISEARLVRVGENLARLGLSAEVVAADVLHWEPGEPFDAVLLDAPCTATGTIRRHPDILHLKRPSDLGPLVELQSRLLDCAAAMVRPGGMLVYSTCSLEPEEGEHQIVRFLERNSDFARVPLMAGESGIAPDWITTAGDLRTLPFHSPGEEPASAGMDAFFAARLRRASLPQ